MGIFRGKCKINLKQLCMHVCLSEGFFCYEISPRKDGLFFSFTSRSEGFLTVSSLLLCFNIILYLLAL